jgi:fatty acid desaturase
MNLTWQDRLTSGNALVAYILAIPLLGCVAAVHFDHMGWLALLALWFVFMEGAFVMIPLAYLVVAYLLGR